MEKRMLNKSLVAGLVSRCASRIAETQEFPKWVSAGGNAKSRLWPAAQAVSQFYPTAWEEKHGGYGCSAWSSLTIKAEPEVVLAIASLAGKEDDTLAAIFGSSGDPMDRISVVYADAAGHLVNIH
jgi:hypothetical protein